MADEAPKARFRFLFNVCNDVAQVRRFYVGLLGLKEAAFTDTPQYGWLSLDCGGFEAMWSRADAKLPVPTGFACQPGWAGGTLEATSWGVQIPEERFAQVHRALAESGAALFRPVPDWRQDSYWGISVLDPMGVTVEVYATPRERPATTTWPGT
jgi:catechol 2,3-dioxygenase-like lactoylglutathione lyase family enzyme